MNSQRHYSIFDKMIQQADGVLRTLLPGAAQEGRPSPRSNAQRMS